MSLYCLSSEFYPDQACMCSTDVVGHIGITGIMYFKLHSLF